MKPSIRKYMSQSPHTIGREQTLNAAHDVMRRHGIRHLPVLEGGKLMGLVSQRDLHLIETLRDVDPAETRVDRGKVVGMFTTMDALNALAAFAGTPPIAAR
jgi:acetoin utilization protein AcuB